MSAKAGKTGTTKASAAATWEGPTVEIEVGAYPPVHAMDLAAKRVATEEFHDQVGFLLEHVGPRVTWASLGLKDPRQLTKWWQRTGAPKSSATVDRVHLLFQIAYAVTAVYDGGTAARFLRSSSPYLDDAAPGEVLRGASEDVRVPLLGATRYFLGA